MLSPGHSPAASSALSLPRQAGKRSSHRLFPNPELLISPSPNCLFSPLRWKREASYHLRKALHGMPTVLPFPFSSPKPHSRAGNSPQYLPTFALG